MPWSQSALVGDFAFYQGGIGDAAPLRRTLGSWSARAANCCTSKTAASDSAGHPLKTGTR